MPAKRPLKDGSIRFFDFECYVAEDGHHVPNYAAVTNDGVTVREYHAGGASIIEAFVRGEFCEENRGCVFVAHNARGYDAQFIKAELLRQGILFQLISNGRKLMQLTVDKLRIRIIDSLNFIPAPLSSFPKLFGLHGVRKGLFPYRFNVPQTWSYVGPIPSLELFMPDGHSVQDLHDEEKSSASSSEDAVEGLRAKLIDVKRWHDELKASNYVWVNSHELREYGKMDVLLGFRGVQKFRQEFLKITETNAWSNQGSQGAVCRFVHGQFRVEERLVAFAVGGGPV